MKIKTLLTVFVFCLFMKFIFAQVSEKEKELIAQESDTVKGWKKGGVMAITLSQTSLTNWASGGQNSLSLNGVFSLFANYKKDKAAWDNSFNMGYGILKQGDEKKYMKTDDKIDFLSKYGHKAYKSFYYAVLFNFKTQMTAGYNYPNDSVKISDLFAPAYLLGAIGMDYKPSGYFSVFIAPATGKITFVNDQTLADAGAFGVEPATYDTIGNVLQHGKNRKNEFGGYMRMIYSRNDYKSEFFKNVSFTTKIDLFSNYLNNPQNIDISWETLIALKVNKYISVNFNTHLIYDDDTEITLDNNKDGKIDEKGPRIQFKEILGVGFSFKF